MEKTESGEKLISITRVWEGLFLGGLLDAERLGKANPFGISVVISLSETAPCNLRPDVTYIHLAIEDAQAISVDQFTAIIGAIAANIRRGKVLLHCGSGISRAPLMVAAYLHVVGYKNFDAALKEIAGLRPYIAPWATLIASVREHLR
jgi:protein-tyrosine phosphatase